MNRRWTRAAVTALTVIAMIGSTASPTAAEGSEMPGAPPRARRVAVGAAFGCAVMDSGKVVCWGSNFSGQLGRGLDDKRSVGHPGDTAVLQRVPLQGRAVAELAAGDSHVCALTGGGQVVCWGSSEFGQLGRGDTQSRGDQPGEVGPAVDLGTGRSAVAIAAGGWTTCAILDNGSVKCWGVLWSDGFETNPRIVGDQPGEMGDALPVVPLGRDRKATSIAVNNTHACAVLDNGELKCWGDNQAGELGIGDTRARRRAAELGDALPAVDLGPGRQATAVTVGNHFTCVILDNGSVACWGRNAMGQLGIGSASNRGDQPGEMGQALRTVDLGRGRRAIGISAGLGSVCALRDDGTVVCWGEPYSGALGQPFPGAVGDEPGEMGERLELVRLGTGVIPISVSAGFRGPCVLTSARQVKCWGQWEEMRGDEWREMGDNLPAITLPSRVGPTGLVPRPTAIAV